jgi:hypothetical protein
MILVKRISHWQFKRAANWRLLRELYVGLIREREKAH